jgi:drug/metabolite transporter (DMT)-like permease
MNEIWGVLAATLSSATGGTSIAATRYLVSTLDPFATGSFRFGIGFCMLLPVALLQERRCPDVKDWPMVAGLGLLFFGVFPILFNAALMYTTAARGALALSTLPLLTMVIGAVLGVERLTASKAAGVFLSVCGVAIALLLDLSASPAGAWRGDLLMLAAAICMALYSIWSKALMTRSAAITFTTMAMGVGAMFLIIISLIEGSFLPVQDFQVVHWSAAVYLGAVGSAMTFYLWAYALERTTPTKVAVTVTVNPIVAALVAASLLNEPLGWNLVLGIIAVTIGIWLASLKAPA